MRKRSVFWVLGSGSTIFYYRQYRCIAVLSACAYRQGIIEQSSALLRPSRSRGGRPIHRRPAQPGGTVRCKSSTMNALSTEHCFAQRRSLSICLDVMALLLVSKLGQFIHIADVFTLALARGLPFGLESAVVWGGGFGCRNG